MRTILDDKRIQYLYLPNDIRLALGSFLSLFRALDRLGYKRPLLKRIYNSIITYPNEELKDLINMTINRIRLEGLEESQNQILTIELFELHQKKLLDRIVILLHLIRSYSTKEKDNDILSKINADLEWLTRCLESRNPGLLRGIDFPEWVRRLQRHSHETHLIIVHMLSILRKNNKHLAPWAYECLSRTYSWFINHYLHLGDGEIPGNFVVPRRYYNHILNSTKRPNSPESVYLLRDEQEASFSTIPLNLYNAFMIIKSDTSRPHLAFILKIFTDLYDMMIKSDNPNLKISLTTFDWPLNTTQQKDFGYLFHFIQTILDNFSFFFFLEEDLILSETKNLEIPLDFYLKDISYYDNFWENHREGKNTDEDYKVLSGYLVVFEQAIWKDFLFNYNLVIKKEYEKEIINKETQIINKEKQI